MLNKKIGFIGFGNMAQAIVQGWLRTNTIVPNNIYASAAHIDKLIKNTKTYNINACNNNEELINSSEIIIIAIKPYQIEQVLTPILELFKGKLVISIAAGWNFDKYETLGLKAHHISTIPNTPIAVNEGILITEEKHSLTDKEYSLFEDLFKPIALIEKVEQAQLSIGGTLAGCTPAYTAMYMEALADAGVKHGLSRDSAYRIAAKMIIGTGSLYLEKQQHPGIMKDAVCSPSGTTIKGVASLEKNAFRGAIIEAIDVVESK